MQLTGVVEDDYVVGGINYTLDSATGDFAGLLYFYEDANYLYFAFEQSVAINDNTYQGNSIGWDARPKPHKLRDLTQSDHAKITLYDTAGTLILDFYLDYATVLDKKAPASIFSLGYSGGDGSRLGFVC